MRVLESGSTMDDYQPHTKPRGGKVKSIKLLTKEKFKQLHLDFAKAMHDGPARFCPYDRYPKAPAEVPASGVLSLTEGSTAEKGHWLLGDCLDKIVQIIRQEFSTS